MMSGSNEIDVDFRVVVAGSSGVGKSSIIQRIARDAFSNISNATIGIDYVSKNVVTNKNVLVRTCYTDLAGQERFRSVCRNAYRGADAVLIVIDASKSAPTYAFEDAPYWVDQVSENAPVNVPIILLANKVDTLEKHVLSSRAIEEHGVTLSVIKRVYANRIFYTSARTGEGAAEVEAEVRRIEEATTRYHLATRASARHKAFESVEGGMTAERAQVAIDPNEPLLCIVPTADGSLEVLRARGLVNLNSLHAEERSEADTQASASSVSQSSLSPLRRGNPGCSC